MFQSTHFLLHNNLADARAHALLKRHHAMRKEPPPFEVHLNQSATSHRFPHIVCLDETRYNEGTSDAMFYHANWVDGYKKEKQYLLATAPHNDVTTENFWRMASKERPNAIVLMHDADGQETGIKHPFWPQPGNSLSYDQDKVRWLVITNKELLSETSDFRKYRLMLIRYQGIQTSRITTTLFEMTADGSTVPGYFPQLRNELSRLSKERRSGDTQKSSLLLVSGDGVTKNGNFCVYDIVVDRALDKQQVELGGTVQIVRRQRYGTVWTFEQYRHLDRVLHARLD